MQNVTMREATQSEVSRPKIITGAAADGESHVADFPNSKASRRSPPGSRFVLARRRHASLFNFLLCIILFGVVAITMWVSHVERSTDLLVESQVFDTADVGISRGSCPPLPPALEDSRRIFAASHHGWLASEHSPTTPIAAAGSAHRRLVVHEKSMRLMDDELLWVKSRHRRIVDPATCPRRYLLPDTRWFGRHFNQLQETMNAIMWAEDLNRTAVLGWFYSGSHSSGTSTPPEMLYDFSLIKRHYCVITLSEFEQRLLSDSRVGSVSQALSTLVANGWVGNQNTSAATADSDKQFATVRCYGRCLKTTDLMFTLVVPLQILQCTSMTHITKLSQLSAPLKQMRNGNETISIVGSSLIFFVRRSVAENAALYGLLRPSAKVQSIVDPVLNISLGGCPFFGVHLRNRENTCNWSIQWTNEFLGRPFVTDKEAKQLLKQCNMQVGDVNSFFQSYGARMGAVPGFIASDGQNPSLVSSLLSYGKFVRHRISPSSADGLSRIASLLEVVVDAIVLSRAVVFYGNQLSSMSQSVCFMRLGQGESCHMDVDHHFRSVFVNASAYL